ncbi:sensor histidine kinase [Rhizohabitans arisaemae]|uniref:sensor histidine kinase n=1 Tax=Rhizohabitans arisaemae TaxID=2720610 RepID=UPI0024B27C97|nr:ATP-binding protein [Rhizohabitans arisaemae]
MGSKALAGSLAVLAGASVTTGALLESGLPAPPTQWMFTALALTLPALGWLFVLRRPDVRYGWLLLATGLSLGLGALGVGLLARSDQPNLLFMALAGMFVVYYGLCWVFVPLLFPDGRLPSRRWRPFLWIAVAVQLIYWAGATLIPFDPYNRPNPAGFSERPWLIAVQAAIGLSQLFMFVSALVILIGLIVRWRRSQPRERGQYAWMVAGLIVQLCGFAAVAYYHANVNSGVGALLLFGLPAVLGSLPVSIGVAVVRHQLLDIKIGISGSRLTVVFDVRPGVGKVLARLGTALEDTAEPVEQLGRLAAAVRATLDTTWVVITLGDGTRVVSGEEDGEPELTLPVHGGLGQIHCGPRTYGRLTDDDRRLLEALAVPAGLAIQSAALATRLVNAQEAERRRIQHNIHDGVQQQLVALIAGLELARATGAGPDVLTLLREQARQTLNDLRELAAGIHPSALSQGGLVEAVEERCSRLPVPTKVIADAGLRARRFPDEIEGAMYFTVSEAIANALKHAGASKIEVRLTQADGRLRVGVIDNGKGFAFHQVHRRGLATLADRLNALGGNLEVVSEQGKGTQMNAWVPANA